MMQISSVCDKKQALLKMSFYQQSSESTISI